MARGLSIPLGRAARSVPRPNRVKGPLISLLVTILSACSAGGVGDMGSRASLYTVAGEGRPVVVFEAGAGNSRLTWSPVYLAIGSETTVFAYDRPGMHDGVRVGPSEASDAEGVRTGEEAVEHLRELLAEARVAPPYVLVGHSLGGQYALTFAKLYPDEVTGIVLVDSRPPSFAKRCEEAGLTAVGGCFPSPEELEDLPSALRAEVLGMLQGEARVPPAQELREIPITLIVATEPAPESTRALQDFWMEEHRRFAEGAENVRYVEATGAGHYVHQEDPELVIEEIRALLDRARGTAQSR